MIDPARHWLLENYPLLFDTIVSRLVNSPNKKERDLLFLGFSIDPRHAILMPWNYLLRHAHILGDPGSGKTARCLTPLASQLIARGDVSVVIFDLKGDLAQFHNAKAEAERAGRPFRWFTNRIGWSSFLWNIFREPFMRRLSREQVAQLLLAAAGLDQGEAYGAGFFTSSMRLMLVNILERYGDSIHSIADLHRYCADANAYKGLGHQDDWKNSRHFVAVMRMLSALLPLNATANDFREGSPALRNSMSVEEVLTTPVVYYFFLPATVSSYEATCGTRLFLYALAAAASIYQPVRDTIPTIPIVDESQLIATKGLPLLLNQARSLKIGMVLAHQSLDQLKLGSDLDLTQIVLSSTAVKQVFRASDLLTRDYLSKTGGEALYHRLNWQQVQPNERKRIPDAAYDPMKGVLLDPWTGRPIVSVSEDIRARLEANTIMGVSSNPNLSFLSFTEDDGPIQYEGAWSTALSGFHIDLETYQARMNRPWPEADEDEGTVVVPPTFKPGPLSPAAAPLPKPAGDIAQRVQDAIRKLQGGLGH